MSDPTRASSSGPARYDVAVIGGGMGGLVVARDLAVAGRRVVVVEASDRLGGEVMRHTVAGLALDGGAESFATRGDVVATLARDLGLGDDLVVPDARGAWVQQVDGSAFPLPKAGLLGIPASAADPDVADAIGPAAVAEALALDAQTVTVGADETKLGPLVRARLGQTVLDRLVAPVVTGVHSLHPDELDIDRVAPGLRAAFAREGSLGAAVASLRALAPAGSAVGGIRGGTNRLVERLVAELEAHGADLRLGARADAVDATGATVAGERLDADRVVLALGGRDLRDLAGRASSAPGLITLATLVLRDPRLDAAPRGTGVLVAPGTAGVRAKALTHATVKWPWLAERADGRHVVRLSYDSPAVDRSTADDELRSAALADASALLGIDLTEAAVDGFARVTWSAPLRGEEARETSDPAASLVADGVLRVGGAVAGRGLAAVVAQARATAAAVIADADPRRRPEENA
ncbi:protoporphyrinogen/coproporphyrinogen oxidase [Frigoribacterium sp. 2-23]|uniref:protoporphyrinogen/coproporphyrinogen oxidase n=1 Tax=Frigoribacterium sp. 2-23 TaxID=3415006 RepID=UPI003C6EEF85